MVNIDQNIGSVYRGADCQAADHLVVHIWVTNPIRLLPDDQPTYFIAHRAGGRLMIADERRAAAGPTFLSLP